MNKKTGVILTILFWIILILAVFFLVRGMYTQRNWEQERLCISSIGDIGWYAYEPYNCSSGYLYDCKNIKDKDNAWVQSCECKDWGINTTGHYRICPEYIKIWRYTKL